jgi:hypothetical protein
LKLKATFDSRLLYKALISRCLQRGTDRVDLHCPTVGGLAVPRRRLNPILGDAIAVVQKMSQVVLCYFIALFGGPYLLNASGEGKRGFGFARVNGRSYTVHCRSASEIREAENVWARIY